MRSDCLNPSWLNSEEEEGVLGRDKDRFMYEDYELPIAVKISKIYICVLDRKPVHVGGWWVD